jgi:peptidoglycan hydrolase CwlO-like protein
MEYRRRITALVLPVLVLFVFLSSVAAPAQAPAPQASASKPTPAANRVAALESRVNSLSKQTDYLQKELNSLVAARYVSPSGSGDDLDDLKERVDRLETKVRDLDDDVERVKSDIPSVSENDVDNLKTGMESLQSFRKAICSLTWSSSAYLTLHTGFPEPCPAF